MVAGAAVTVKVDAVIAGGSLQRGGARELALVVGGEAEHIGPAMTQAEPKVMSWGMIVAIVVVTMLGVGVLLGALGQALSLAPGRMTAGVGAAGGVVGALLVTRRRAMLAQRQGR